MTSQSVPFVRAMAHEHIDAVAGDKRRQYINDSPGQVREHMAKEAQAEAFLEAYAADPMTAEPGAYVALEAAATGLTAVALAELIVSKAVEWREVKGPAIESQRVAGKKAVTDATGATDDEIRTAIEAARVAAVEALSAL